MRACIIRANHLSYGNRVLVRYGYGGSEITAPTIAARDIIVAENQLEHSSVGIEVGPDVEGVLIHDNRYVKVSEPVKLWSRKGVLIFPGS